MKKLGRKLVLSSLSLGLAVVTLSTTTYAWYTSNTDVSAKGMNGAIAGGSAEGLLISKDGVNFSAAITFTADDIAALTHNGSALKPLQYKAGDGGGLETLADNGVSAEAGTGHEYLQFSVYVKTTASELAEGSSIPVYFNKLDIKNTTTTLPSYNILSDYKVGGATGTSGWGTNNGTYSLDAIQALSLSLTSQEAQTDTGGVVHSSKIVADYYSLNNYFTSEELKASTNLASTVDALDYYNAIMHGGDADTTNYVTRPTGYAPADIVKSNHAPEAADANSLEVISITDISKAYEVIFTIWLDGWDAYCFDACRGQSFSIDFGFTTVKKDSAVSKPAASNE